MDKPTINNCKCDSSNVKMKSFKNNFYGFLIKCDNCGFTVYDKAIPIGNPEHNNLQILDNIQKSLVYKWNIEVQKKN